MPESRFIPPPDAPWETVTAYPVGPNRVDEERPKPVRWVPLIETNHVNRSYLGLTDEGEWINAVPERYSTKESSQRRGHLFGGQYQSGYFYLTPMLDWSPSVVRSTARDQAERYDFDVDAFWEALPWKQTIRAGIRSARNQYVNPALDWTVLLDVTELVVDDLRHVDPESLSDETRSRIATVIAGAR